MATRRSFLQTASAAVLATRLPRALAEGSSAALAADPLRPQCHLLPPGNWMNDPNGPIVWQGEHHLFYQVNPHGAAWGDISWGHAVSFDLVHWRHLPVALTPTAGTPDSYGVFSGSCLSLDGKCLAFYTAVERSDVAHATLHGDPELREQQCLALASDPGLLRFERHPEPLLPSPPAGLTVTGFRDPALFRLGETQYLVVGSGVQDQGGLILLYRATAPELTRWEYLHPLWGAPGNPKPVPDPVDSGTMWECPDVFELDGHHVVLFSTERKVFWAVGSIDPTALRFVPKKQGLLDTGAFYAPKSQLDREGRRILWGWIPERRSEAAYTRAGWSGVMSYPRLLSIGPDGSLRLAVAPEISRALAGPAIPLAHGTATAPSLAARLDLTLPPGASCTLHAGDQPFFAVAVSTDGAALTCTVVPDTSAGAADPKFPAVTTVPRLHDTPITLFTDASVLELFQGDRAAHTARTYPALSGNPGLAVTLSGTPGGRATLHPLRPISPNRLTT